MHHSRIIAARRSWWLASVGAVLFGVVDDALRDGTAEGEAVANITGEVDATPQPGHAGFVGLGVQGVSITREEIRQDRCLGARRAAVRGRIAWMDWHWHKRREVRVELKRTHDPVGEPGIPT